MHHRYLATATAVTAADPMLAHYRRCRLRVLQFCADGWCAERTVIKR